jgi:hypothetical protein
MARLVDLRKYVVFVKTKADDITFGDLIKDKKGRLHRQLYADRILIDPPFERQFLVIRKALKDIWEHGGWSVFLDELYYIDRLGLRAYTDMLLTQGRSKGISVITGMQRPVWVTRFAISEVSHVICFRLEGRDLKTIADVTSDQFAMQVSRLNRDAHNFAHFHVPTATVSVGNANVLERTLIV